MERREFIISLTKDIVWQISLKGFEEEQLEAMQPYKGDISKMPDYSFGQEALTPDGKWAQMLDLGVDDERIEMAKKDESMQEVCDFELRYSGFKFTGTFVDALKYIKKAQEDYTRKNG